MRRSSQPSGTTPQPGFVGGFRSASSSTLPANHFREPRAVQKLLADHYLELIHDQSVMGLLAPRLRMELESARGNGRLTVVERLLQESMNREHLRAAIWNFVDRHGGLLQSSHGMNGGRF